MGLAMEGAVKVSALCAACALFAAPMRDFEEVRRRKQVGDRSVFPFVCMWACSSMWIVYGLFTGDLFPTVLTNLCGFILSMYYCAVFAWAVEPPPRKSEVYNLFAATFLMVCFSTNPQAVPDERVQQHAGTAAAASTALQYASPLTQLWKVLKRRSTEGLSRLLAAASFVCSSLWLWYGLITSDAFVYLPNLLGVVFSITQITLFWIFPRKGRSPTDTEKMAV